MNSKQFELKPSIGNSFPEMTVQTTFGNKTLPVDYAGKWFILFSHPGDFTPVCTTEFVAFQQLYPDFQKLQTELIGLSVDQVQSHLKWTEWIQQHLGVQITFPIIADPLGRVAQKLGMIQNEKQTTTVRGVYIVDDQGIIRAIFFYPAEIGRNLNEIYRTLYALQTSDIHQVALPADWPKNSLIGKKGIIPPAATEQQMNDRIQQAQAGEIECFDWWFCYKDIGK
ncbi:peroxiredoxin (alkyl hydroperoxide reductase subunit C) [Oikeobacillus pervagus]|uniref:Peroxiredoxin n=1 Tax=Oikeobacillus pervagus TaxID=1325931 RepID=A0AAJ1T615_9BACI|nr:peroxiredoxin [Oikeobacillus pervagus]MDQ0215871.1 peroxiredoxin (alkyl hydroperoxide reductase subunit C) [Oikeobacillus pervagus]